MNGQQFFLIGLLCAVSVACAPTRPAPERITEVRDYNDTFLCDGDQRMQVRFTPFAAALEFQGASIDMRQQPTADGLLYTGGGQSLRAHGDAATETDGKGAVHNCRATITARPKDNATPR
jgi:hypothetical protein